MIILKRTAVSDALAITLAAVAIGFAVNLFHPKGYSAVSNESLKYKKIVFINSTEAKIKFDSGSAVFADSRSAAEFAESRVKGAINIPALPESTAMSAINENHAKINSLIELVIYCTGETCGSSEILARRIAGLGYSRTIYIMTDGLPGWSSSSFPLEKGDAGQ